MPDNRNYQYSSDEIMARPEYPVIERWIPQGARVIDLGCGNGSLLRILKEKKGVEAAGIEIADSGVRTACMHGLDVRQGRIDEGLDEIPDDAYDYAICNVTLQMVMYPERLLGEMKRIARHQIISFPNFAFALQRLDLMVMGRMPRRLLYGYDWYSTGHIHQLSIADFERTVKQMGLKTMGRHFFVGRHTMVVAVYPNVFATEGIYLLKKEKQ